MCLTIQSLGVSSRRKQDQSVNEELKNTSDRKLKRRRQTGESKKRTKEEGPDIWFDDVPLECVNRELVGCSKSDCVSASLITGLEKR